VRAIMAELHTFEDDLERSAKQQRANADEWRRLAECAVRARADDLAREALARAREHDAVAAEHARELDVSRRVTAELRAALLTVLPHLDG
jgi:phage shock protein A